MLSYPNSSETDILKTRLPPVVEDDDLIAIDLEVIKLLQWVCFLTCEVVDVFATVTNIINIICFVKQGFKDPVNISLLGLAISDLLSVVMLLWTNICVVPAFQEADLPFDSVEVQYPITGIPHVVFTRITSCITALITLERCLCVTMPLQVKIIMTPKRVTIAVVSVFVIPIVSALPMYSAMRLTMRFDPDKNRTLLGLIYTYDQDILGKYFFIMNNVLIPFTAFFIIIICMVILVFKLHQQATWRVKSAVTKTISSAMSRDLRVAKMVVMISILFVACFIPSGAIFLSMALVPGLNLGGKYFDLLVLIHGFGLLLESTNSSLNIFIYYHMSTRYMDVFNQLFRRRLAPNDVA